MADGSLVLKLYYDRDTYDVTYDSDGGSAAPAGGTYKFDETVTVGASVTKTGYVFAGWKTGTDTYNPTNTFNMPAENVTLTAQWTAATDTAYKVEHYQQNANDGNYTLADTDNLTGTTGDSATGTAKTTYTNSYNFV